MRLTFPIFLLSIKAPKRGWVRRLPASALLVVAAMAHAQPQTAQPPATPPVTPTTPTTPVTPTAPVPPATPAPPPAVVVLSAARAVDWLTAASIPARIVSEADLPAALTGAPLVVLPLQEVRRPETVAALKDYLARDGRVIATGWGPPGIKTPVADPLAALLGIRVTGWSGRGNTTIAATVPGRPLFNGTGRLRLGRGYSVIADLIAPPPPTPAPSTPAVPTPPRPASPAPPFVAGRWVKQDGRPLRPKDTAVIQGPSTIWVAEDLFAAPNASPEARRWFANAVVTVAPALRLPAKQAELAAAQARIDAAKAALASARANGVDAPLNDAQASLDTAAATLAGAAREMDFSVVLKSLDAFSASLADAAAQQTPSRPVEIRAVWIEQSAFTKSIDDVRRLVARLADARFNVLLPEVVYRGRAAFPSGVYPQDPRLVGFDPLRAIIDEAHRRGLEVHPWVWTLCAGADAEQGPILRSHPEWAARDRAGRTMADGTRSFWLTPSDPSARATIRNVIREIAARYDVDGIHLDYLRDANPSFDYSDQARAGYESAANVDPITLTSVSPDYAKWHLWREAQVNSLVREIRDDIRSLRPGAKLSASVAPAPDAARRDRLQDWPFWLKNRWLDWVAPMVSTQDGAALRRSLDIDAAAALGAAYLVPGLDAGAGDPSALAAGIGTARAVAAQGAGLSTLGDLTDDTLRGLKLGAFRTPAVVPWKDPRQAAATLATASATAFGAVPTADEASAIAARAAAAALTAWAAGRLDQMATSPLDAVSAPPLADARYDDARSLADAARRIVDATLRSAPDPGLKPTAPPIVTVADPLPLPSLKVPLTTARLVIDGKLDEPAWQSAPLAQLQHNTDGSRANPGASARVLRDAATLYIGFSCPEPNMAALKAVSTGRDARVYSDDSVEVFLSTNDYGLPYCHFVVGAGGGTADDRSGDSRWNSRWTSAVVKEANGWTVEIAIPFSTINAQAAGTWRANFTRSRFAEGPSFAAWSPPYGSYHTPDRFGALTF